MAEEIPSFSNPIGSDDDLAERGGVEDEDRVRGDVAVYYLSRHCGRRGQDDNGNLGDSNPVVRGRDVGEVLKAFKEGKYQHRCPADDNEMADLREEGEESLETKGMVRGVGRVVELPIDHPRGPAKPMMGPRSRLGRINDASCPLQTRSKTDIASKRFGLEGATVLKKATRWVEEEKAGRKAWRRKLTLGHCHEGERKEKQNSKQLLLDPDMGVKTKVKIKNQPGFFNTCPREMREIREIRET
ncbi:hypothetical protein BDZ89DRAFT_1055229 [Hymenopellis radicata]|nr:hypothetical protein BDZ89DRAFT_1055229 [Hymenopellis radicata]